MVARETSLLFRLHVVLAIILLSLSERCATQEVKSEAVIPLTIKEIHKVMRNDSPSGNRQNIRVVLDLHDAIEGANSYILSIQTAENKTVPYIPYQFPEPNATVIEFEGNFVDATAVFITAENGTETLASGSVHVVIEDPMSRVAWVGDPKAPLLRVDPGSRDKVEIPGQKSCVKNDSLPCYYFNVLEPPPARCDDLTQVVFCDDIVSKIQGPSESPSLELYERESIQVVVRPSSTHIELVVFSPENNTIFSPHDFACTPSLWGSCSQYLAIPDNVESFDVVIAVLDEEGYVNVSSMNVFEVYKASVDRLAYDVFKVTLDPSTPPGNYTVWLNVEGDVQCEGDTREECHVFFAKAVYEYNVTISRNYDTKMVTYLIPEEDPPMRSIVEKITSLNQTSKMRLQVKTQNQIANVELISFKDNVATTSQRFVPESTTSGYTVDIPEYKGDQWDFVVLGFGSNGSLLEVGQAYVVLQDLDINVAEVGWDAMNSSSLRVDIGSQKEVILEDVGSCVWFENPCYFFPVTQATVKSATYCINVTNTAERNHEIVLQCGDSVTPFSPLSGDISVSLEDIYKMEVKGHFPSNTTEVTVFDKTNSSKEVSLGKTSCNTSDTSEQVCTRSILISDTRNPLSVLVAALDSEGVVLSSVLETYNYPPVKKNTWTIFIAVAVGLLILVIFGLVIFIKCKT